MLINRDDLINYYVNELNNAPFKKEYNDIFNLMHKELDSEEIKKVTNRLEV